MRRIMILFSILVAVPCYAWAQDIKHPIDQWMAKCIEEDNSTAGMRNCTSKAYEMWDKELNKTYSDLMKRCSPQAKRALKSAQLSWIKFRDSEFKLISETIEKKEGTMWILVADGDRMDVVKSRALQLKIYLDSLDK